MAELFIIKMKNGDENFNLRKNKENICSICKCDKLPINISKIKEKNLKQIITKINKKDPDTSALIKKCNCKNNNQKAHKICILLNIIFNFDLNCKECKANYNIKISKNLDNYKKCCNICSFISLLVFHICLYAWAALLVLYIHIINKDIKNNFEENKLYHIYYFFAGLIVLINTFIIIITFSKFLDKNNKDIFNYDIDIKDINEQNKNNNNDKYYDLLYKYYRYFYNGQIRYLIDKKQKILFMSRVLGGSKDLADIIKKNNKELIIDENIFNNGGEDILNLNKKKIENEKLKQSNNNINNNINNNNPEQGNGITNMFESFKKQSSPIKEEEEKNNDNNSNKDKLISLSNKKSENTNPINKETKKNNNIEENIKISNELIEKEEEQKQENENRKENELDNNNDIEKENKINDEKNIENKNETKISVHSVKIHNKKKDKKTAKTYFYKKLDNNNLMGKAKTLIDPKKKMKSNSRIENKINKEKKEEQIIQKKIKEEENDKKYVDSTFLGKNEKEKSIHDEDKNNLEKNQILEDDPFNMFISVPFHNNGK